MNGDVKFWNGADVAETITTTADAQRMPDKKRLQCVVEVDCLTPKETQTNRIYGTDAAYPALNANEGGGQNRQAVLCYENHAQDSRIKDAGEVSPQLNAKAGMGGNNLPLVQTAVAIAENTIGRKPQNGGNGTGAQEELAYTQNAAGVMGVAMNTSVRRLMPIETERLMGFPDNWTRIVVKRYKHKPTSKRFEQVPENFEELENGEWVEYAADSVRYKACGNSMCVNVMRWIGMRIDRVDKLTDDNEKGGKK